MHSKVADHDVMIRTIWNIDFVYEYRKQEGCGRSDGPFEVTQLVNSFLGALAIHGNGSLKPWTPCS